MSMERERRVAIRNGDIDTLTRLLEHAEHKEFNELLAFVCREGTAAARDIAELLLKDGMSSRASCGADKSSRLFGKNPFHLAAERGLIDLLDILVPTEEGPGALTDTGETALHCVIRGSNVDDRLQCVEKLVVQLGLLINVRDDKGYTALHLACKKNQWDTVEFLIQRHDANIDFFVPINGQQAESAKRLINSSGRRDLIELIQNRNRQENQDITTQLFASLEARNEEQFIHRLRCFVVDPNADNGKLTLLQLAVINGMKQATVELLAKGANVNGRCNDSPIVAPLMLAAIKGDTEVFKILIDTGYPDYSLTNLNYTLLHYAVMSHNLDHECVRLLLEKSHFSTINELNIDAQDDQGCTALHHAVERNRKEMVQHLLKFNANIFISNNKKVPAFAGLNYETLDNFFDSQISINGSPVGDVDYLMSVDFNFLFVQIPKEEFIKRNNRNRGDNRVEMQDLGGPGAQVDDQTGKVTSEVKSLELLKKSSVHRPILNHPLIGMYLNLKFDKFSRGFYVDFILWLVYSISLTVHVYCLIDSDSSNRTNKNVTDEIIDDELHDPVENTNNVSERRSWICDASFFVSILLYVYLIVKFVEIRIYFSFSLKTYASRFVTVSELALICISIPLLMFPPIHGRNLMSVLAILIVFVQLILLICQHPRLLTYYKMFLVLLKNFLYYLLCVSPVILAVGLPFHILFRQCEKYKDCVDMFAGVWSSPFRTIVKLEKELNSNTTQFGVLDIFSNLFLLFILLTIIVLTSLLNGLSFKDIQEIRNNEKIKKNETQIEFFTSLEKILFKKEINSRWESPNVSWLKRKLLLSPRLYCNRKIIIDLKNYNEMIPNDIARTLSCKNCSTFRPVYCNEFFNKFNAKKYFQKSCVFCIPMKNTVEKLKERYAKRIQRES